MGKIAHEEIISYFNDASEKKDDGCQYKHPILETDINDDMDGAYFEELSWNVQDMGDPEISNFLEELLDEEIEDITSSDIQTGIEELELEDQCDLYDNLSSFLDDFFQNDTDVVSFLTISNISDFIPNHLRGYKSTIYDIANDLKTAKNARLDGNPRLTVSICNRIIKIFPCFYYVNNLLEKAILDIVRSDLREAKEAQTKGNIGITISKCKNILKEFPEFSYAEKLLKEVSLDICNNLKRAKTARLKGDLGTAILICKEILREIPYSSYAKNLLIATYGDAHDAKGYELAIDELKKGNKKDDFKLVLFGLLGKMEQYPNNFISILANKLPDVLEEYYNNLGNENPKKPFIYNVLNKKVKK